MQAEAGDEDGNAIAMLTLQWRNIRGKWTDSAQVRSNQSDAANTTDQFSAGVATTWRDGDRFIDDVELGVRAETGDQNQSLTLSGQHRSQYGRGMASMTSSSIGGHDQMLTSLGYDTSLVMGAGRVAMGGGPNLNEAGVLLDLRNAPDARIDIIANGQSQFIARGGRVAALTLPPYHQYRLRMNDSGVSLAQLDNQPHEVTLYPGHVVAPAWNIQSIRVLIGRIVLANGQPLANARIEGAEGPTYTDDEGYLQTEISSNIKELLARTADGECRIRIPEKAKGEEVIRAGALRCTGNEGEPPVTP